jgi:iron complex outermembrane recepter protein
MRNLFVISLFFISNSIFSQAIDTVTTLESVEVSISRLTKKSVGFSLSEIKLDSFINSLTSINELTNNFSGLFATSPTNFAQDTRLSSRGFGARSAFGIRGIKIITDEFPDSTPDGQAQLDNIDFASLKTVEFLKGPYSGLHGNNSGGILNLRTFNPLEKNGLEAEYTNGSFALQRGRIKLKMGNQKLKSHLSGNFTSYEGFRALSSFKSTIINSVTQYQLNSKDYLKLIGNYVNSPYAFDAGALTLQEVGISSKAARAANEQFQANEKVDQLKLGILYNKVFSNSSNLKAKAYFLSRHFENILPFENNGAVTIGRIVQGGTFEFNKDLDINKFQGKVTLGGDYELQSDDRKQFKNNKPAFTTLQFDQNEEFKIASGFILNEWKFANKFGAVFNLRFDDITTTAKDAFLANGDQSGKQTNQTFNYSSAFSYQHYNHQISLIHSTGFENPILSELSNNPNGLGGFNTSLKPMISKNYEINLQTKNFKYSYLISAFNIETKNEILGFEINNQPGRSFFKNAGSTLRKGIEVEFAYQINSFIKITSNYTLSSIKFTDIGVNNGKKLPGIPISNAFGSLELKPANYGQIIFETRYVGEVYLNDLNTIKTPSYTEINLKMRKDLNIKNIHLTLLGGANNLGNTSYFSNLRINAAGSRYYEPAMPRNYFVTIKFSI